MDDPAVCVRTGVAAGFRQNCVKCRGLFEYCPRRALESGCFSLVDFKYSFGHFNTDFEMFRVFYGVMSLMKLIFFQVQQLRLRNH